jgi:hypothetical protein
MKAVNIEAAKTSIRFFDGVVFIMRLLMAVLVDKIKSEVLVRLLVRLQRSAIASIWISLFPPAYHVGKMR